MKQSVPAFTGSINPGWKIAIVHASFYKEETESLATSAESVLENAGIPKANTRRYPVFGSFEIPLIGAEIAKAKEADAIIGLGIVVEGETHHARLLADAVARGIMETQLTYGIPFAFEVLYVDDIAQARARLDRGGEAATAVLHSLALLQQIRS